MRIIDLFEKETPCMRVERYVALQDSLRGKRKELLLFCSHPPVLTAGIQSKPDHLLEDLESLHSRGISLIEVPRGGGYTAHEPGQIVIYVHVDLSARRLRISDLLQAVTDMTIDGVALAWKQNLEYRRATPGFFNQRGEKIGSMGFMVRRGFTSFGLAINVANSLETFRSIVACGLSDVEPGRIGADETISEESRNFRHFWIHSWKRFLEESRDSSGAPVP